jgi:adenylate cyclase
MLSAMARIVLQLPGGRFREHTLGRVTRLGRHPEQDVQVLDPLVSKAHAIIEQIADEWYLRDLDSRNGTWVNTERVTGRIRLNDHDRIKLGTTHLVFMVRPDRRTQQHVQQVRIGEQATAQREIAVYRESPEDFLPADLVRDDNTLKRDYEKLRLAHRMGRLVAADVRLDVLLPRILDHLFALFKADRGVILLINEAGQLTPRAVQVHGRHAPDESIQLSETILASVTETRTAVLTRDAQMDPRFEHAHSVIAQGIRASMCAPLLGRDGSLIGAIHLDSLLVANAFTESDLGMMLTLAAQAGIAVENARLLARLERDAVVREQGQRHLAPQLAERVVRGDVSLDAAPQSSPVAVLWFELRRWLDGAETAEPEAVMGQVDAALEKLVDVVFEFEGTLERFSTEHLVVVWGAPFPSAAAAARAVRCAGALHAAVTDINHRRLLERQPVLAASAGVDFGLAVSGRIGPARPRAWTVVGPPMGIARHLAQRARHGETLVSGRAHGEAGQGFAAAPMGWVTTDEMPSLRENLAIWSATGDALVRRSIDRLRTIDAGDMPMATLDAQLDDGPA